MHIRALKERTIQPRDEAIAIEIQRQADSYDQIETVVSLEGSSGIFTDVPSALIAEVDGTPAGFATLFHPDEYEWELYAAVAPEYRQQGIFSDLAGEIRRYLGNRRYRLLFVCNRDSSSGGAVLTHLGLKIERTEYVMELDRSTWNRPAPEPAFAYQLKQVGLGDLDQLTELSRLCFDEQESTSRPFLQSVLNDPLRTQYMLLEDQKPIGLGAAVEEIQSIGIFGLGIIPDRRGRGLGRLLLNLVIAEVEHTGRSITLEVDDTNITALKLYRSSGFNPISTYDYYL